MAAGLKQQDVAEALAVTTNFVSMIERGKREPTLKYLKAFARFVKIPLAVLLWEPPQHDGKDVANGDLYARLSALMAQYAKFDRREEEVARHEDLRRWNGVTAPALLHCAKCLT